MRRLRTALAMTGVLAIGSMAVAAPSVADAENQPEQWRSYWADSFAPGIHTPDQVDELVDEALAVNANALIVQVGRWMDCFCNRSTFPRTHEDIAPEPYDPLEYVIEQAHEAGLEVHAWVNATPMWNADFEPPQPDHIYYRHGPDASGTDSWLNTRQDGTDAVGETLRNIDPAHPDAVDYVVEGIDSIVAEYDVDGINLDYIRYPDGNSADYQSDWGYSPVSLERFQRATGRDDVPEPTDAEFSDWRRDQVTSFVRKIFLTMAEADPQARLSINGITYWYGPQTEGGWEETRTYSEVMQDWKAWLEEGIIDLNVAMNYKVETDEGDRIQMFDEWSEVLADWQADRHSVVGPGIYLNTVEDSLAQARRALQPTDAGNTVAGWSGYSYATPSSVAAEAGDPEVTRAERDALAEGLTVADPTGAGEPLFAEPAAVPSMPWKQDPAAGYLVGELRLADETPLDQVGVEATHLGTGERVTGRVTDGSGWFGFVDLTPGRWLVRVDLPTGVVGAPVDTVVVEPGEVANADFSLRTIS